MPKTVKVHVTFNETKRLLSHQKGADVQRLRPVFLEVFSDVLSSDIAPAQVKFQLFDDKFEDYVELSNETRLEEDMKIRAFVTNQAKQAERHSSSKAATEIQHYHHWMPRSDCSVPWTPIGAARPIFQRPHPVKKNTTYRLFNPVSRQNDGLIERDPKNDIVNCSGSFNSGINTVLKTTDETAKQTFYVALTFTDNTRQKEYVLTGNGKDQDITAVEYGKSPINDKSIFEPLYYWSYTMFRNKSSSYNDLYLGCDHTGKTMLVENDDPDYPNPQVLFILNKFKTTTP